MRRLTLLMVETFFKLLVLTLPPAATHTATTAVRTGGARREGPLKPGSKVVAVDDPLNLGVGVIASSEKDGRLKVEFKRGDDTFTEVFDAFDLELLDVWLKAEKDTLTIRDLRKLRTPDSRKQ